MNENRTKWIYSIIKQKDSIELKSALVYNK